ncbi:hypothetical protein [Rhodococcus sp. IEGM 1330]|uniref:hypothetical protein n=1 Tax=Rhodococcus sp. IEGM 1330 TaxID=3082225 RepID=UPI0029539799|nr:hypothetical protein [Rhodococcus sp. IEGM 1330]MDV8023400.1 hypothetical protein [Rhodococcus sp. IEGM 1330]
MSFYVQHGYGKGSKIFDVYDQGSLTGVVLSPGDEDVAALKTTVTGLRSRGLDVLLDPQSYIYSSTPAGSARRHSAHALNFRRIKWSQSAGDVASQIASIEAANTAVGIHNRLIAPTCIQSTFTDIWTPLALQYARSAVDTWGGDRTIASVAIDEGALSNWKDIADWLDVVTTIDVRGFYLVVNRATKGYPPAPWDSNRLSNLLRLVYTLSEVNEYEVHWGYSDLEGLLGLAAGATAISSGWFYTLRQFFISKWQPSPAGGQPPTARVYLPALWASLKAQEELSYVMNLPYSDDIVLPEISATFATRALSSWTRAEAQVQFMMQLSRRAEAGTTSADVPTRLDTVEKSLREASSLYSRIARDRVVLPPAYAGRVTNLLHAVEEMRNAEGI